MDTVQLTLIKKRLTFILELTKIDLDTILELERESNAPDG